MNRIRKSVQLGVKLVVHARKDVPFEWNEQCEHSLNKVKEKLTKAPVLVYFNPNSELVVQADSSQSGRSASTKWKANRICLKIVNRVRKKMGANRKRSTGGVVCPGEV